MALQSALERHRNTMCFYNTRVVTNDIAHRSFDLLQSRRAAVDLGVQRLGLAG